MVAMCDEIARKGFVSLERGVMLKYLLANITPHDQRFSVRNAVKSKRMDKRAILPLCRILLDKNNS